MEVLNKKLQVRKLCKSFDNKKVLDNISFDVYEGEQVEAGQKSVAFSLALRANNRTLKDEEANAVMERVLQRLQSQFGARLRGM